MRKKGQNFRWYYVQYYIVHRMFWAYFSLALNALAQLLSTWVTSGFYQDPSSKVESQYHTVLKPINLRRRRDFEADASGSNFDGLWRWDSFQKFFGKKGVFCQLFYLYPELWKRYFMDTFKQLPNTERNTYFSPFKSEMSFVLLSPNRLSDGTQYVLLLVQSFVIFSVIVLDMIVFMMIRMTIKHECHS